ncbi:MAG: hypothetical protein ACRDOZ_10170 [Nocardioides sp.]
MLDGPTGGVLAIAIATAVAAVAFGAVFYFGEMVDLTVRLGRLVGLIPPLAPTPVGMPLERIAADLRRLHVEARRHQPGMSMAKYRGAVAAYDDALLDACRALDLWTELSTLPEGVEREAERLRVEFELERAGINFREG